ncbi:hypothetical protein AXX17_ATUG01280 [Arabidopsis thaliana]|uniref:At2g29880-like C-terminal domain-containing protein n=1 Tax=Arabidopsis thaliana TaxID=3702 RepID=A0A178U9Q8_ARATH|nr:hypothetical protein AXX17_ATUG01280 [Arabidopsis thaliana]
MDSRRMQTESIDHFEDLQIIFGDAVATGSFAVGMSDSTCPRIYTVGERSQGKETVNQDENIEEVYEFSSQHPSSAEYSTPPFTFDPTTRGRSEKLLPRKRTRGGGCNNSDAAKTDHNDSMITIPDLDEHIRYKAVTMIHSLGMKDVFTDMSIEERFGWIKSNFSSR